MRETYGLRERDSISQYLQRQDAYKKYKAEIRLCQSVRNVLAHEPRFGEAWPVEPGPEMLAFLDELLAELGRPFVRDIAIRRVYARSWTSDVWETMGVMRKRGFAHVPVLEGGLVTGVFSENSVFNYLADHPEGLAEGLRLRDLSAYASLTGRGNLLYLFVPPTLLAEELEDRFEEASRAAKRVAVAFVTRDGTPQTPMEGIVTPYDLFKT